MCVRVPVSEFNLAVKPHVKLNQLHLFDAEIRRNYNESGSS